MRDVYFILAVSKMYVSVGRVSSGLCVCVCVCVCVSVCVCVCVSERSACQFVSVTEIYVSVFVVYLSVVYCVS